jgi:biotin operon repressor
VKYNWTMPVEPLAFVLLWREARYIEDLAAWLARPAAQVEEAAEQLRGWGIDLEVKMFNKDQARAMRLVRAWQGARTHEGVALELGWPLQRVLHVARRLRKIGVCIKTLPHHPGYQAIQVN